MSHLYPVTRVAGFFPPHATGPVLQRWKLRLPSATVYAPSLPCVPEWCVLPTTVYRASATERNAVATLSYSVCPSHLSSFGWSHLFCVAGNCFIAAVLLDRSPPPLTPWNFSWFPLESFVGVQVDKPSLGQLVSGLGPFKHLNELKKSFWSE